MSVNMICHPISSTELSVSSDRSVTVVAGVHSAELELAELTVGEIFEVIASVFNIDEEYDPYLNGEFVEKDVVLLANDRLEFVRAWGKKGGGDDLSNLIQVLEVMSKNIQRIADHIDPPTGGVVGTKYVAERLGKTQEWIGRLAKHGEIPSHCIVKQSGNGRYWKFHKEKIDQWVEGGVK